MITFGLYVMTNDYMQNFYPMSYPQDKAFKRPFFLVINDSLINGLIWLVPLSSQINKYKPILSKYPNAGEIVNLYGKSISVVLTQNIVPALPEHIDREYTVNGVPYVLRDAKLEKSILSKASSVRYLLENGKIQQHKEIMALKDKLIEEMKK